jgi:hypothetical protein
MSFVTAGESRGPVGSGIDCFVMQDNRILGYSVDLSISEDYQLDRVKSLGYFGAREIVSLGYDANFTMGTFLLRGTNISDALSLPGWQSDGNNNINSSGYFSFTTLDIHTLTILTTILGAKYGGGDLSIAQGTLMSRQTRWGAKMVLPGLQTS